MATTEPVMTEKTAGDGQLVGSVQKAFAILDTFSPRKPEWSLTELATELGLNKSTLFGLLRTMERSDYVTQNPRTKRYRLGMQLLNRATLVIDSADVSRVAPPYIDALRDLVQENTHLGVLHDGEVVYLYRAQGPQSLSVNSRPGMRAPAHCTAMGKAMLAFLPEADVAFIARSRGLGALTAHTITDVLTLQRHLAEIRHLGYAVDAEEFQIGSQCIAAPVFDLRGQVVAAISVSVPSVRMGGARRSHIAQRVTDSARTVSEQLGWQARPGEAVGSL